MKILIATDGSDFSTKAIEMACELAKNLDDVSLRVVSVYEPQVPMAAVGYAVSSEYYEDLDSLARGRAEKNTEKGVELVRSRLHGRSVQIDSVVELGRPTQIIVEMAENWEADLIVVGSHGYGFWGRLALGSISNGVVHHARCSVLVVKTTLEEFAK